MIYLFLDTNIILNLVVQRKGVLSNNNIQNLINLIDSSQIRLIVPEIIKIETSRHLFEQIDEVEKRLKRAKESINELYGVSTYSIESLDLEPYKKQAQQPLNAACSIFSENKSSYINDIDQAIELLFNHSTTVSISDDKILSKVWKRVVYKKAPTDKPNKHSFGDGIIIESLINLCDYVKLNDDDIVYFASDNYKDFAVSKSQRTTFHEDIKNDLIASGLYDRVVFVNNLDELIHKHLKDEIENIESLIEIYNENEEEYSANLIDEMRESAGLTPLDSFVDKFEENFNESIFSRNVCNYFEELNGFYDKSEELFFTISEEILERMNNSKCNKLLKKLRPYFNRIRGKRHSSVKELRKWLEQIRNDVDFEYENFKLPDYLEFGNEYEILSVNNKEYILSLESLEYLQPLNDYSQTINVSISDKTNKKVVANGNIEIYFGYIEFNEEGNVGNGAQEEINYELEQVEAFISEIVKEWEEKINNLEKVITDVAKIVLRNANRENN